MLCTLLAWLANSDTNNNSYILPSVCSLGVCLKDGIPGRIMRTVIPFCDKLASGAWYLLLFLSSLQYTRAREHNLLPHSSSDALERFFRMGFVSL